MGSIPQLLLIVPGTPPGPPFPAIWEQSSAWIKGKKGNLHQPCPRCRAGGLAPAPPQNPPLTQGRIRARAAAPLLPAT